MRAIQIVEESGPDSALRIVELPEPEPSHMLTPGEGVVVEVHDAGVSFPELLQTRGQYQMKPALPYVPGSEVGGVVLSAPAGAAVSPGDRVAAFCALGGWAEQAVAPAFFTFPLSPELDFAQGAALILNYHTAYFSLVLRGGLSAGETVLVHGAAGGVGTASLQVAKGMGARTIALVSSEEKARVAEAAGADEVVLLGDAWKDEVTERSGGGVDVVMDPVGGDRFTDSLRCLREDGRLLVVGFAGGSLPGVRSGDRARGWRRRRHDGPCGRRPLHRQPALSPRGRAPARRRLHRRLDPRGQGQSAAAAQHLRGRGRLGRLRDGQARAQPRGRRGRGPHGG